MHICAKYKQKMGKLDVTILIILCSMLVAISLADAALAKDPKSVSKWFEKLSTKKEKVTKLHFYFHDILSGKNPTAARVASANNTNSSPNFFGLVMVIDDPLTVGPESNSTIIGRAQGIYASAAVTGETALLMNMNLVFTSGKYNGSTLSLLGRNAVFNEYREMPIVSGSGLFRLARGIATAKSVFIDLKTGDAIVEYHVIVLHY